MSRHRTPRRRGPVVTGQKPLTVAEVMTRNVITIGPDAPLTEAVSLLADSHVSGVAVVDAHGRLIGVISTQDILAVEAEAHGPEARSQLFETATVRDVMTPKALTVGPELELREAAMEMEYADVHRLFVLVDEAVVGVLSRSDVNRAFARRRS